MKFTAKITLNGGHHVLSADAIAGMVGQHPIVRCGMAPARGEVVAAELDEERCVLTLTIDVEPSAVTDALTGAERLATIRGGDAYPNEASMDASIGYIISAYTLAAQKVGSVDLLEILPTPAEPAFATPQNRTPQGGEVHPDRHTFVDYLRVAYADPGSVVGARLGREQYGEAEPIGKWAARAAIVVVHERDFLARTLMCSQCGMTLRNWACGPTHALMAFDPWQHRDATKPKWDPHE